LKAEAVFSAMDVRSNILCWNESANHKTWKSKPGLAK